MSIQLSHPGPAYRIQTQHQILRCWNPADAPLLKSAIDESIDHLYPWMPWAAEEPRPLQQKVDLIRRWRGQFDLGQDFVYGIFNLDESRVLGGSGLHTRVGQEALEIGYWIHREYTGRGLATEAAAALTRVAFEVHRVQRVEIHCDPQNTASARVAQRLGYTHEATLRNRFLFGQDRLRDLMIWSLFAADFPASPAARAEIAAFDALGRCILP
jgi:RimJ/RimL family protein N-acetyltransferase